MECTYCGSELVWEDSYGNKEYIIYGTSPKSGDIYRCTNHEGFDDELEATHYAHLNGVEYDDWEEICCDSSCHNVSGSFYTDNQDNLYEGYPC